MNKLMEARTIINDVDKKMIELFKQRMEAARMVAEYKKENNLPVYDSEREAQLIASNIETLNDDNLEEYYLSFFKSLLDVSKQYQVRLIDEEDE